MTDLPGHDGKMTSDKKITYIPYEGYKGGNRDYCSHFPVTFKTKGKFLIVFIRLILGKVGLKDLPGHDGKVTSDKKMISISHQGYRSRNRGYCSHFSVTFETTAKFLIIFVRLILGKVGVKGFTGPRRESDIR